jgi:uncharacterized protein YsxB (DUF464 family)
LIELKVNLYQDGSLKDFQASGHAGSGKKGEDIVCAAVTVLLRTTARLISREKSLETRGEALGPGGMTFFLISMPAEYREWVKGITDFLLGGLLDLKDEFPNYLTIDISGKVAVED